MVFAVRTGLRIGEIVVLRWNEDIDLERGRVRVQRSYNRDNGILTTKNDEIREVPLTWDAIEALKTQRERVGPKCELVFPGPRGGLLPSQTSNEALKKIGAVIEMPSISNHKLRHTFASHAVMRGIPIRQVQEWLGHGDIHETMRYAHLSQSVGDEMIRRLAPPRDAAR